METAFYIVGSALVVIALVISFIGMRSERFPSGVALRIGIAFVAVVVVATAVLAVRASKHEALQREHEENAVASESEDVQTQVNQDAGAPSEGAGGESGAGAGKGDPAAGEQVFIDDGCGGCHSLQATNSTGDIGPNLDTVLVDANAESIHTSIVDPGADIAAGYSDGIMPSDYGNSITPEDLDNLVAFLYQSTHQGSK